MFVFFCQPYRARELKELKCLCADDEKTLMSWIMGVRLAKVMLISLISIKSCVSNLRSIILQSGRQNVCESSAFKFVKARN